MEEKIKDIQVATDISILAKYALEETTKFIKNKLSDLGKTYEKSLLEQQKVLLGSIFPSGMAWNYPGISNRDIGPLYQQILAFTTGVTHLVKQCDLEHFDHYSMSHPEAK